MSTNASILEKLFSSEVKVQLLVLFHENPGIVDTIEGVARRIGRKGHQIRPDLEDFVNLGILKKGKIGNEEIFRLDRSGDKEMRNSLDAYFESLGR
jgi:hypothetical protein